MEARASHLQLVTADYTPEFQGADEVDMTFGVTGPTIDPEFGKLPGLGEIAEQGWNTSLPNASAIEYDQTGNVVNWQDYGACAQTSPEEFFPEKGQTTREAKRICGACIVRAECLEYALANDEPFGVWGGLSERERRRLKRINV